MRYRYHINMMNITRNTRKNGAIMADPARSGRHFSLSSLSISSITLLILSCLLLASCTSGGNNSSFNGNGGKDCTRVGILLPETTASRWEEKDHPLLIQFIKNAIPNVHIDYSNAHSDSAVQLSQAEQDIANGDCILVVAPHDSVAAAAIVAKTQAQNIPVIAYDRLIQSKALNYYVSFDNTKVGQLQGQYIADHYTQYAKDGVTNMVMISGSQTDTNALLFSVGAHNALDPLLANSTIKNISETFTPNWDSNTAEAEMTVTLANQQNNLQIAYVANDDMANGVITALKTVHMNGKVLITGQDASPIGIHNILMGDQNMTVYKPFKQEAQSVGELVKAIHDGVDVTALTNGTITTTFDGGNIPSILDIPTVVNAHNIASTVIADGFTAKSQVCNGVPRGTDGVC